MEDPLSVEINVQAENKQKNGEELQANFPLEKPHYTIILNKERIIQTSLCRLDEKGK